MAKAERKSKSQVSVKRSYPKIVFEEALRIATCLKEFNGGNSWTPREIAKAAKIPIGNELYYYTAAARDFDLTTGTSQSKEISLTESGREIVYAPNPQAEKVKKNRSFSKS